MNQQDKDLEIFGDMIIKENNGTGFMHYSSIKRNWRYDRRKH